MTKYNLVDMKCPECDGKMHKRGVVFNAHKIGAMQKWWCSNCGYWMRLPLKQGSKVDACGINKKDKPTLKVCLECPLKTCVEDFDEEGLDLSKVSRVEVANAVHCVPEHISQVFMGKANVSLPLAYDIAKYLGTTVDYLYQAISGANGQNPRRKYVVTYKDHTPLPPKYSVEGKGYPNLREALLSLGIDNNRCPTHYDILPDDVKVRIVRNRPTRGR